MRPVLGFPNPVNEIAARVVAAGVLVISLAALLFQEQWLLPVLAFGFWARLAATWVVVGSLAAAASLESLAGYCLGCRIFAVLMRVRWVPEEVCTACSDILERRPEPSGA